MLFNLLPIAQVEYLAYSVNLKVTNWFLALVNYNKNKNAQPFPIPYKFTDFQAALIGEDVQWKKERYSYDTALWDLLL